MHEYYSWRKCRGLIFREYLKFCVPPLFQSVFNLTKGMQYFGLFPVFIVLSTYLSKVIFIFKDEGFGGVSLMIF